MALSWCAFGGQLTCRVGGREPRVDSVVSPGGPAGFDGGRETVKKLEEPHTMPSGNHAHRSFSPLRWTAAAGIVAAVGIAMCTTGLQANAAVTATWHAQMPPNPSGATARRARAARSASPTRAGYLRRTGAAPTGLPRR